MLVILAAVLVALGGGAVASSLAKSRLPAPAGTETATLVEPELEEHEPQEFLYRLLQPVLAASAKLGRRLSPAGHLAQVERRLMLAGLEARVPVERVFAAKMLLAGVGLVAGFVLPHPHHIPAVVGSALLALAGFMLPGIWLDGRARSRQARIAAEVSEAVDLVAVTVEAGLGLEQAMSVVAENLPGPLAHELSRVLREMELGVSRREALISLRERTDVPELSSFVVSLIQADETGASIGEVLKAQAAHVRMRRRQVAREKAAKTPVKILFPVIFGVLPALIIVAVGPAIMQIAHAFKGH